jgi:hypothetical protein
MTRLAVPEEAETSIAGTSIPYSNTIEITRPENFLLFLTIFSPFVDKLVNNQPIRSNC